MTTRIWIAAGAIAALIAAGCGTKQSETDKKLAEMQAQLEATRKQLEESKTSPPQSAAPAPAPATPAPKATAPPVSTSAKVAANKDATAANKSNIEKNSARIDQNAANIEKNRQGVDEAKKTAAPAPFHTLPAGTPISIRISNTMTTKTSASGSLFDAELAEPLEVEGYLVAKAGAQVEGIVTAADPGGKVKGVASIAVGARSIMMADGRRLPIRTGAFTQLASSSKKKDVTRGAITTGIGAAIGAIAGGGKGAAIGAGAGAAGGVGLAMATKGAAAEIPAETVLTLQLSSEVRVQELKK